MQFFKMIVAFFSPIATALRDKIEDERVEAMSLSCGLELL